MKKVLLSISLITNLLNYTNAQIKKGSWLLEGGLHYKQETCDDYSFGSSSRTDMTNKHLDGTVGYFLSDKLALGVSAGVDAFNRKYVASYLGRINMSEFSQQNYHVSPFARYYFNPKSKFKTFYELSIGGNWDRSESTYFTFGTTPSVGDHFYLKIKNSLGANYFLTQNLALEASIDYNQFYPINDPRFENKPSITPAFHKLAFTPKFGIKVFLNTEKQDAQILAAKYLRKGNMTIGLSATADVGNFNYGAMDPSIGYFLTDKWMIMGSLSFYHNPKYLSTFSISPELRYYKPVSATTQIFFRGAAILGAVQNNLTTGRVRDAKHSVEAGIGLNRFISENVSVQGSVNLNVPADPQMRIRPNVKVGFQYFLTTAKK